MKKTNKLVREMRGTMHQQQLAEEINVSRESISKYEILIISSSEY